MSSKRPPQLKGKEIFEITPVILGGSPTDPKNKTVLSRAEHIEAVMHLCSDNIAVVQVSYPLAMDKPEPQVRTLRVSVPDADTPDVKLFKKSGNKVTLSVPLLYLNYDPWGFVPFADLKGVKAAERPTSASNPPKS